MVLGFRVGFRVGFRGLGLIRIQELLDSEKGSIVSTGFRLRAFKEGLITGPRVYIETCLDPQSM